MIGIPERDQNVGPKCVENRVWFLAIACSTVRKHPPPAGSAAAGRTSPQLAAPARCGYEVARSRKLIVIRQALLAASRLPVGRPGLPSAQDSRLHSRRLRSVTVPLGNSPMTASVV